MEKEAKIYYQTKIFNLYWFYEWLKIVCELGKSGKYAHFSVQKKINNVQKKKNSKI